VHVVFVGVISHNLLGQTRRVVWFLISDWRQKKVTQTLLTVAKIRTGIRRQRIQVHGIEADLAGQYEKIPLHVDNAR
jgi:hypothetical protein